MREMIANVAGVTLTISVVTLWVSWAVQAAAQGKAIQAAIVSPIAVIFLIVALVGLAMHMGWISE